MSNVIPPNPTQGILNPLGLMTQVFRTWTQLISRRVLPPGGDVGQVLAKLSADDYDVGWIDNLTAFLFVYRYAADTVMADPGDGLFRFNNADYSLATKIAISETDRQGTPHSIWEYLKDGDFMEFKETAGDAEVNFQVTAPAVDQGTWQEIDVVYIDGSGLLPTNRDSVLGIIIV